MVDKDIELKGSLDYSHQWLFSIVFFGELFITEQSNYYFFSMVNCNGITVQIHLL